MDWQALFLSLELGLWTVVFLLPISIYAGWALARYQFYGKWAVEALLTLPLILPPTVVGFYLIHIFAPQSPLGGLWQMVTGGGLLFEFEGLVMASVLINLPLAIQPSQRAFFAVPQGLREAAVMCGYSPIKSLFHIELPLAWHGVASGLMLSFAHSLGEFGVVLMVGGAIAGETKLISIAIYEGVQSFDDQGTAQMSLILVAISLVIVFVTMKLGTLTGMNKMNKAGENGR